MHLHDLQNPRGLTLTNITLPSTATNFAGVGRRPAHVALIEESRLLMNHPFENNWWVNTVRQYIQTHSARIMADIEAPNEGVPLFRRPGQRPVGH
jgi:hypothetical protein